MADVDPLLKLVPEQSKLLLNVDWHLQSVMLSTPVQTGAAIAGAAKCLRTVAGNGRQRRSSEVLIKDARNFGFAPNLQCALTLCRLTV